MFLYVMAIYFWTYCYRYNSSLEIQFQLPRNGIHNDTASTGTYNALNVQYTILHNTVKVTRLVNMLWHQCLILNFMVHQIFDLKVGKNV